MAPGRIDSNDVWLAPMYMLGSLTHLGLLDFGDLPIIGDPSATLVSLAGASISIGAGLSLFALAFAAYSNQWTFSTASTVQLWAVVATVGLLIAPPFLPVLSELIGSSAGVVFSLAVQTTAYTAVSFLG